MNYELLLDYDVNMIYLMMLWKQYKRGIFLLKIFLNKIKKMEKTILALGVLALLGATLYMI